MTNAELINNDNDECVGGFIRVILRLSFHVIRHSASSFKKLPPPTPDRREGRLFPPEHLEKLGGY
jgi:hypothetical protein